MLEIERKFLLNEIPDDINNCKKKEIIQWYFKQNKKNIRVRKTTDYKNWRKYNTYTITRKKWRWLIRNEDEKKISEKQFLDYRELAKSYHIEKTRYLYQYKTYTIEIDQFHDKLDWLWIGEIEFWSVEESKEFNPISWLGTEVTERIEAGNNFLSVYGMNKLIKRTKHKNILTKFQLRSFYNQEAQKYSQTRKKHRWDASKIIDLIQKHPQEKITILELGCWSWRFLTHLGLIKDKEINYIWVDISENLLEESKKIKNPKNIKTKFVCKNMTNYLAECKQESVDIIVGIASFQHLTSKKERFLAAKYMYRCLNYEWLVLMTNRSFSLWMLDKHWKTIIQGIRRKIINPITNERNNLMIPWKSQNTYHKRFYHIFIKAELKKIFSQSWFVIMNIDYLKKDGKKTENRKESNNTLLCAQKTIFTL